MTLRIIGLQQKCHQISFVSSLTNMCWRVEVPLEPTHPVGHVLQQRALTYLHSFNFRGNFLAIGQP